MRIVVRAVARALRVFLLAFAGAFAPPRPVFLRHEDATAQVAEADGSSDAQRG